MIMENENVQQPSYEQLANAYNNLLRSAEQMRMELEASKTDRLLDRLKAVMQIVENKEAYSAKIVKLAEWHIEQILAKTKA